MATEQFCEICQLPIPQGDEYVWTQDCFCAFPKELVNLCKKHEKKENRLMALNLEHVKQFRRDGSFPKELAYIVNTESIEDEESLDGQPMGSPGETQQTANPPNPGNKRPLPKTPAKPPRSLHIQDSIESDIDDPVLDLSLIHSFN